MKKFKKSVFLGVLVFMLAVSVFAYAQDITLRLIDPANDGEGIKNWGPYLETDLVGNVDLTDQVNNYDLFDIHAQYVTVNGVKLSDRITNPQNYGVGDYSGLGAPAKIIVNTARNIRIYFCGGGEGGLDPEKENTIIIHKDFPIVGGTVGKTFSFSYDPDTREWTGSVVADAQPSPGTGDSDIYIYFAVALACLAIVYFARRKRHSIA